ncbi:hypothetical protein [Caulobacter endophyticus]|uniref:hypothetical protein n=1 Tax=Caulobacter endophyticus TaxID=2172652 RepID=UPI00240FC9BD|nr:hypothetical protein [Caulobacter endophyticus]MDG2529914.1 hypothetical protein [Caulobacter endophyticus]
MNQYGISDIEAEGAFSTEPYSLSDRLLGRIKTAYRSAIATATPSQSELWSAISQRSAAVHEALVHDDRDEELRALLTDPGKHFLFYGFDNLFKDDIEHLQNPAVRSGRIAQINTLLSQLTDALGCRLYNEEFGAGHWATSLRPPTAPACLDAVRERVGEVHFPNPFPSEHGLPTPSGIVTYRAIHAIYQAVRTKALSNRFGRRVVEVGGGLGRSAFYSQALGIRDYTIIDLPLTGVAQALFLAAALGENRITLAGEARVEGAVAILPPTAIGRLKFDLLVNVDSVTEMSRAEADGYAAEARRSFAAILSINHEANTHTAAEVFGVTMRETRSPYWLRPGYTEEVYIPPRRPLWR